MLSVNEIGKTYGSKHALENVSFSCGKAELIGLIGQNGAGKTTLLNILAGRLAPSSGSVKVCGHDILWEPEKSKSHVGYLPERPGFYDEMTVSGQLKFVCRIKGIVPEDADRHIAELAERTGISDVLGRRIGNLSKGYRQRVGIAAALAGNPEIVLLDEPTTGLDPVQIKEMRSLVRDLAKNQLVILSTHLLRDLDGLCTRALMLDQGRLIKDYQISRDGRQQERTLRVEIAMGREAADHLLNHLPSVKRAELLPAQMPGITAALITGDYEAPMERELFQALVKAESVLMRMSPVKSELEEIFLSALTVRSPEEENA